MACLFAYLAAPPILAFSLAGLWSKVLPHWPAIGWLFALPLLGELLVRIEQTRRRALRRVATATAGFLIALLALLTTQAATGWLERLAPSLAGNDPTLDLLD